MGLFPALVFLLPVIWFYAFFDALNRINMTVEELELQPDEFLFIGRLPVQGVLTPPLSGFWTAATPLSESA